LAARVRIFTPVDHWIKLPTQRSGPLSPHRDPVVSVLPTTPPRLNPIGSTYAGTPRRSEPVSPPFRHGDLQRSPPTVSTPLTTAQDLLQNVLGVHRSPAPASHQRTTSSPAVNLIPGNSIWSSIQSSPFHYSNGNRGLGSGSQYVVQSEASQSSAGVSLPPPQSSWSSPYPWQAPVLAQTSQDVQSGYNDGSSRSLLPQQPSVVGGGHHRLPSETLMTSRSHGVPPPIVPAAHRYDPLNSSAPLNTTYGGSSGLYPDAFSSTSSPAYYNNPHMDSFHHAGPNHVHANHSFIPQYDGAPSASRIWNNPG
jgi:hypothetical protein